MENLNSSDKGKQRSWNPETLRLLKKEGSDLSKQHNIVNVFHICDQKTIAALTSLLEKSGYHVTEVLEKKDSKNSIYWLLHAMILLVPEISKLNSMTDLSVDLAEKTNSVYDGWYTRPKD